jgi:hypothetical protein
MCWSNEERRLLADERRQEEDTPRFEPEAESEPPEPEPAKEPERELVRS